MAFRQMLIVFRQFSKVSSVKMLPSKTVFPQMMTVRSAGNLLPKSQYDIPINKDKFACPRVFKKYWETIPLFAVTGTAIAFVFSAILWAVRNKVDAVFSTHSRGNISRTMDLRDPTVHKIIIINQKYKPWPEMQATLDRMKQEQCDRNLSAVPASN